MLKKFITGLVIEGIMLLKKLPMFKSIVLVTGQLETEHYIAKTGLTVKKKYPKEFMEKVPLFNTIANALKYYIAKVISTTGNGLWIGSNTLMTQSLPSDKDGLILTEGAGYYPTTTTKDDGGTGAEAYVKFKGVRTAAGSETIDGASLGLDYLGSGDGFNIEYATGTLSQGLVISDVYTVNWTVTIS